jgi:hypothetical protein
VHVHGDVEVTRSTWFGPLSIALKGERAYRVAAIEGFGLVPGINGATLGYHREVLLWAATPEQCRVIFVLSNQSQSDQLVQFIRQAAADPSAICSIQPGERHEKQ